MKDEEQLGARCERTSKRSDNISTIFIAMKSSVYFCCRICVGYDGRWDREN